MKHYKLWGFGCLLFVFITAGWFFLFQSEKDNLAVLGGNDNLIRLHVLANSDSIPDQQLKLKVRDAVIAYLAPYLASAADKEAAKLVVLEHHHELITLAQEIVVNNGASYPVSVELGVFDFPIKSYGSLVLPAGKYEAVRVLIGNAEGKNWWCVLFPPLCFIDITNTTAIATKEITETKEQQDEKIEFRWKIAELWETGVR